MGPTEALIELLEDFSAYCRHDTVTHLITEKQVLVLVPAPIASNAPSYAASRSPRVGLQIHPAVDEWQHHLHRFLLSHLQREHRAPIQVKVHHGRIRPTSGGCDGFRLVHPTGCSPSCCVLFSCGQALSVLEHIFTDFHVLYGDEIISVILPIFDAIYASGTVALTRSVYRRCPRFCALFLFSPPPPQLLITYCEQGAGFPRPRRVGHQEQQVLCGC